jgi:5-hydroxyisourate hydrolase-like protein (transthyretin family)
MILMRSVSLLRLSVVVAGFALFAASLTASGQDASKRGRKYKAPPPTARIEVTVLRDVNGKPIENAAVIFHPMEGERDKGNMELKTNEDGKAVIDVLPIGDTVRLQIIAKGFQTFGDDYKIDKAELAIEIKMKRPGEQYSIYKPHPEGTLGGKGAGSDQGAGAPKDAAPDKPAESSKQPDAKPSPSPAPPQ